MPQRPQLILAHGERAVRAQLESGLILAGFNVRLAATGGEARALIRPQTACLLLDLAIPGRPALEVLSWKATMGYSHIPVLGLTAKLELGQLRAAIALGLDDCLRAPFDHKVLVERARRLIGSDKRPSPRLPSAQKAAADFMRI